jgi:hypothetical protein
MLEQNMQTAAVLAAILVANFGVLIGAYVSLKVGQAVSDVKVGRLEQDVRNLANMIKQKG